MPNIAHKATPQEGKSKYANRYEWDKISLEYIQGYFLTDPETGIRRHFYPTLEDIMQKYGMSSDTIYRRSANEKWSLKRKVFQSKIKEHLTERQVSTFFSESAQHDALTLDKVKKLHRLLDYYLSRYDEILDPEAHMDYDTDFPVNLKDLETATRMLTSMHNLVRSVVGEPIHTSDKENIAAELNVLNPALEKMDTAARKKKIKDLQDRLLMSKKEKQKLASIVEEE